MKLLKSEIHAHCSAQVYQRANDIYQQGNILVLEELHSGNEITLHGRIKGMAKIPYDTDVLLVADEEGKLTVDSTSCDCPAFDTWYGMCKHCVALCLMYSDRLKQEQGSGKTQQERRRDTDTELVDVLRRYSAQDAAEAQNLCPGSFHIVPIFEMGYSSFDRSMHLAAELRAGAGRLYVIKSVPEFVHSVLHGTTYAYGKKLEVQNSEALFDETSQKIFRIMANESRKRDPDIDKRLFGYYSGSTTRVLTLEDSNAARLLRIQWEREGTVTIDSVQYSCVEGDPPLTLKIRSKDGGAALHMEPIIRICAEPEGIYACEDTLYFTTREFQKNALPFLSGMGAVDAPYPVERHLSQDDYSRFCSYVLPKLRQVMEVDEGDVDFTPFLPQIPEFRFYLSGDGKGAVLLRAESCYGEAAFPLETAGNEYRNTKLEKPVCDAVRLYFPQPLPTGLRATTSDDEVYRVLSEGLDRLRETGTVLVDDSLRALRYAPTATPTVGVALHGGLIDIDVDTEGYRPGEINAILDAYRLKKKYYRLKTGEFLSLTEGGLSVVAELAEGIDLRFDKKGRAQTDAFRAQYIHSVLDKEDSGVEVKRNAAFKAQILALKNYRDEDVELPAGLNASLRGYQKTGYRWLCTLSACNLGGILADDMGLGKTVQMLAYFLHLGGSFLVVCPASLIYNWESECRRFAPSIPCHIMRGSEEERKSALEHTEGLTITSYDQLRRDIAFYAKKQFDCCVLDEAQFIRNAVTKAAHAVKQIRAAHRFALTGTPIENRLSDLWSIFDFLMPGYLFRYTEFKSRVEQPVVDGDDKAKKRLSELTAPFILRRKKADVLRELPDKQETVVYVEMTGEQRTLYDAQEQALRLTLQKTSDAEYLHQKLEYLTALTRLRQICCTPKLYLENYEGASGKVDACMELLTEAAESGHKTLVFSQFTGMLELLIARAQELGLAWLYLSGKNTSEQRRDMVQQFQTGAYSVFFISLKAGGTGLNLTAADRVIHFDPWWNIAAEEQATDRTHRIGQKNKVLVTKLVCKDTVEERIIDLQERKRALSSMVMDTDSVRSAALDREALLQLLESEPDGAKKKGKQ